MTKCVHVAELEAELEMGLDEHQQDAEGQMDGEVEESDALKNKYYEMKNVYNTISKRSDVISQD